MEFHEEAYTLSDILDVASGAVVRGIFTGDATSLALDYPTSLLNLAKGDRVSIAFYSSKPSINPNIFLMRGILYDVEQTGFMASFGGLQLIFKGPLSDKISQDMPIYLSLEAI